MRSGKVPSETCLAMVNELLSGASAEGAYCAGLISALAWHADEDPPRALIEVALTCTHISQAAELWKCYWELRRKAGAGMDPQEAAGLTAAAVNLAKLNAGLAL